MERHKKMKLKKDMNSKDIHHPKAKIEQIKRILSKNKNYKILECFSGHGNLTKIYKNYGQITTMDLRDKPASSIKHYKGDTFKNIYKLIANKEKFNVIDIDPYGFPSRLFPMIFLLINNGYLFVTFPIPSISYLNGITKKHMQIFYGCGNPDRDLIVEKIQNFGMMYWKKVDYIDFTLINRVWRFCFKIKQGKATEICNVRNR